MPKVPFDGRVLGVGTRLRVDLVEQITPELLLPGVLANQHRYKPSPLLATTGSGSLAPSTPEDVALNRQLHRKLVRTLKAKAKREGRPT